MKKKIPVERDQYYVSTVGHLFHIMNVCNGVVHCEAYLERADVWKPDCCYTEYFQSMRLVDTLFIEHYLMSVKKDKVK